MNHHRHTYVIINLLISVVSIFMPVAPCAARTRTKVKSVIRVACVGNSVTYGYGLSDRDHDAYPVRLQQMLGAGFEVANFGHSGSTLLRRGHRPYMQTPEFRRAMDFRADWVVIHLGLNDTDPRNWPDWKEQFIPDYHALIDSFRRANPEARILVCRMTPIFERHPRFQSGTRDWHGQIQQAIATVAGGTGTQLVDLYTPLHSRPDLFPDALHPNPEGAAIIAKTVFSALTGDYGGLRLPPVYADGMVLPRNEHLLLEGTADARQHIEVVLSQADGTVVKQCGNFTRADGSWSVELPHMKAGGPYKLTITSTPLDPRNYQFYYPKDYPFHSMSRMPSLRDGASHHLTSLTIDSIFFGDLWLASGQSNMEQRVDECNSLDADLADARRLTNLRLYNMPARVRTDAVQWPDSAVTFTNELRYMDSQGWRLATPDVVRRFSAVAYAFGRTLADSLPDVPIGIICNAVGGSTTESWVDRTTLEREFPDILTDWLHADYGQPWARGRAAQNIARALDKASPVYNPLARHPYDPAYLFEAAIAPLGHLPVKGVLWYQGESNAHNIEVHERLFRLLEESWRQHFSRRWRCEFQRHPVLPFYVVQLSSLNRPSWPAFRDSQRRLADELPHTWMAVTTDLGDSLDVHYAAKRPVGERLALQALAHTYGHATESEGPRPRYVSSGQDHAIVIGFDHADGLTATRGFEIAGWDGIFHPATPVVSGNKIILKADGVTFPQSVRYNWTPVARGDLTNGAALPASTFLLKSGWTNMPEP